MSLVGPYYILMGGLVLQRPQQPKHETLTTRHQRLHDGLEVVRANLVEETTHSSLKLLAAAL